MTIIKGLEKKKKAILENTIVFNNWKRQLITIHVPEKYRRKGHATWLLSQMCSIADRERITLYIEIIDGEIPLTKFMKWLAKFEFEKTKYEYMVRFPKGGLKIDEKDLNKLPSRSLF
jgi:hypothetical protein